MSDISVSTKNIGGTEKFDVKISTGKVNIVKGSSSSGKSSLMRGIHLGLVGNPNQNQYREEAEKLHLDDTKTDQAILKRGSSEGSVKINLKEKEIGVTISKNGMIKGKNSNEKAVLTTMLASLPPTAIHEKVMNPSLNNPNDFGWIVDELSDAGKYNNWHQVLYSLQQETISTKLKYKKWKESLASSSKKQTEIMSAMEHLQEKRAKRAAGSGQKIAELQAEYTKHYEVYKKQSGEYNRLFSELEQIQADNELQIRRKDAAQKNLKISRARLDEAEDLLEMDLIEPDVSGLELQKQKAQLELDNASGREKDPITQDIINQYDSNSREVISNHNPALAKALDKLVEGSGDKEVAATARQKVIDLKKEIDAKISDYMTKRRKLGMAEDQAAAARSSMAAARSAINQAEESLTLDGGELVKKQENVRKSKQAFEAASKKVNEINTEMAKEDSSKEAKDEENELHNLESELRGLETSTTFEVRFTSLNMLPNQTLRLSEKQFEQMFGDGNGSAETDFVSNNISDSQAEIRSRILSKINEGSDFLNNISSTTEWVAEEAEKQRQGTRRIFNEVGTTLFSKLKMSKITSVSLDTDYELEVGWSDGKTTGLTGAGGERTIIAAALLISMRKAYSPEIPILMFDDIIDKLDPKPREDFLKFLDEYAKSENVAIIVSQLDSSLSNATVNVR